jgi:CHASE2 domain-containing sensor protein
MALYSPHHALPFFRRVQDLLRPVVRVMRASTDMSREWKREFRVAAFVALLGLCFLIFGLADLLSFDLLFSVQPKRTITNDVAIIYMDDDSYRELGQSHDKEWDRSKHAALIDRLREHGAKLVVFDVLLDGTDDAAGNKALVEAARRHGKVAVAAKVNANKNAESLTWRVESEPFPELQAVTVFGAVESPDTRQHYRDPGIGVRVPSLATRAVEIERGTNLPDVARERWMMFYGETGTIPWHSYHEVLNAPVTASNAMTAALKNKVVFVGRQPGVGPRGRTSDDDHATPYTRWTGAKSPGVDIIATAYLNLARNEWLSRPPQWFELGLVVIFAAILPFMFRPFSPTNASLLAFILAAVAFVVTAVAAHKYHFWFPWLVLAGVQVPAALACALVLKIQRATTQMARTTAALAGAMPAREADAPLRAATAVIQPGATDAPLIPDYTLLRNIGSGAFGEVWLAQSIIGGYRAVKVIHRSRFEDERPFEREFEGIKHFEPVSRQHDGFVQILHVGRNREGGYFYYAMELADDASAGTAGAQMVPENYAPRTLATEIARRGALPLRECVQLALELSEALAFLHSEGLIHRDIKPANIIYSDGRPKFADIGLVTVIGNNRTWVGTEGYFAPEGTGTPSADLYSLGKTLYRIYSGFAVDRFPDVPSELPGPDDLPTFQRLNRIILKACEKELSQRYATAEQLRADLKELLLLDSELSAPGASVSK